LFKSLEDILVVQRENNRPCFNKERILEYREFDTYENLLVYGDSPLSQYPFFTTQNYHLEGIRVLNAISILKKIGRSVITGHVHYKGVSVVGVHFRGSPLY